jgi:hypothetical protein
VKNNRRVACVALFGSNLWCADGTVTAEESGIGVFSEVTCMGLNG